MPQSALIGAFLAGLLGGLHCFAMCGAWLAVVARPAGTSALLPARALRAGQAATHAGRITTYVLLGAAFGAAGGRRVRGGGRAAAARPVCRRQRDAAVARLVPRHARRRLRRVRARRSRGVPQIAADGDEARTARRHDVALRAGHRVGIHAVRARLRCAARRAARRQRGRRRAGDAGVRTGDAAQSAGGGLDAGAVAALVRRGAATGMPPPRSSRDSRCWGCIARGSCRAPWGRDRSASWADGKDGRSARVRKCRAPTA